MGTANSRKMSKIDSFAAVALSLPRQVHVSIAFFDKNKPVVGGEITATEQLFMSDQR